VELTEYFVGVVCCESYVDTTAHRRGMEVDIAMKLAAPDVVSFDYRRPTGTFRCPSPSEDRGRRLDGLPRSSRLPSDDLTSRDEAGCSSPADFDAVCRSVQVDPDTRLIQSSVTGDWRHVTSTASSPRREVSRDLESSGTRSGPRRRRYGSMRPKDMGVSLSSDLSCNSRTVDVGTIIPASSTCPVDLSSRTSGTVLSTPELVDSLANATTDMVLCVPSSVSNTARSGKNSPNSESEAEASLGNSVSAVFRSKRDDERVAKNGALELFQASTVVFPFLEEPISPLPSRVESVTSVIPSSPSTVRSSNSVAVNSSASEDKDNVGLINDGKVRTSQDNGVSTLSGLGRGVDNVEVAKNCALSTQFATDADLEADLLSSRLLREFREAIKSAVDSISAGRSHPEDVDLSRYTVPPSNFASAQSFVTVGCIQKFQDSFESGPPSVITSLSSHSLSGTGAQVVSCSESAFRRFRMSNIPTPNGVNRCRRSSMVRDDLITVTHRSAVPENVLRHRRSLPDANQLRCLSSATSPRDARLTSCSNARTRASLVVGGSSN